MRKMLFSVLCGVMVGCGGSGPALEMRPVSGTLTWDDGSPIAGAQINFLPTEGGPGSSGHTDESGKFTLALGTGIKGAVVGKHKITIMKESAAKKVDFNNPGGLSEMAKQRSAGGTGRTSMPEAMAKNDSPIPDKYTKTSDTPLEYEVTADGTHTDIPFALSK